MANNCDTTYKITGTKKAVMDFWHALQDMGEKSSNIYLSDIADYYGIDWKKKGISVRGHIYFSDLTSKPEENFYLLTVNTDTAWSGCHELFHEINKVLWDELSISYLEIEPGCDIYCVHDEGDFFTEECAVSCDGEPFEDIWYALFDTIDSAIEYWCDKTGESRNGRTQEEMLKFIEQYEYEFDDTYFYINPLIRE